MKAGLQVVFRGLPPDEALLAQVREHVGALQRFSDDLVRCHVGIERMVVGETPCFRAHVQIILVGGDVLRATADDDEEEVVYGTAQHALAAAFSAVQAMLFRRARSSWRSSPWASESRV